MASSVPPVKNSAFTTYISLVSQSDTDLFQTSVTLAAGDVTVSKDGGGFSNIASLPTEIGTTGVLSVALTGTEMNADTVVVRFRDAAGSEWQDALIVIHTVAQTFDTMDTNIDSILVDTAEIGAAGAGLTAVPWNSAWDAEVESEVADELDTQLADSVPADGTRPTLRQAIYMICQFLHERAVSDTTVTVKKVDGSTSLLTLTINDATNPTSITRAS